MCKKQTSVSHRSTESEIMSLDAGLRLDGLLAFELWDSIVSVFGSMTQTTERTGRLVDTERSQRSQGKINVLNNTDCFHLKRPVFASRSFIVCGSKITKQWSKWSFKGGSPTMKHVSRTHRVALDWLFDRISVDPKIQIKYIDTKNQLADMMTKGNFTCDEWNLVFVQH